MMAEDFFFTISHRILHTPYFYTKIHKWHHQYSMAVGICAEYAHPIEYIIGNTLPFGLSCMILGKSMHVYTYLIWATYRIANTVYGHSGYEFPWQFSDLLPFNTPTQYHDFHHSHNVGNYAGSFMVWDYVFNWNTDYFKHYTELERDIIPIQEKKTKSS